MISISKYYRKEYTDMDENKYPIAYMNHKFPGFIGLTIEQILAVKQRDYFGSGLSIDDYMSLIDPDYPKD
jgi:hypothetical protein